MEESLRELLRRGTWAKGLTSISLAIPRPRVGFWNEHVSQRHATELLRASPPPLRSPCPFWGTGLRRATSQGVVSIE
uniref:Uncharacterized protein n=1 Tax=Monodon monoceros TaxID=40151 RepID=A0A8C6FBV2_MONMO